jgi:prepilin-type N-terminal cleavage/methylation domain-containing protein
MNRDHGFTLIELLIAMAVFSFFLLIVVAGFLNVVRAHNHAIADNAAQDNARVAMDTVVQAVRDSAGVKNPAPNSTSNTLCLADSTGVDKEYWVQTVGGVQTLMKGDGCTYPTSPPLNQVAITSPANNVAVFTAENTSSISINPKSEVELSITVSSSNGTATAGVSCNNNNADRVFCSVVTLTSGAVAR